MAITMADYRKMIEEGKQPFTFPAKPKCAIDGCKSNATHPSAKGRVCEDCYFDQLGDEVEAHPIGRG